MAKDCITVDKGNVTAITIKDVEYKLNKPIAATTFMTNDFKQAFENKNNNRTVEAFLSVNKIGYKVDSSSQVRSNDNEILNYYNLVIQDFKNELNYLKSDTPKKLQNLRFEILDNNRERWFKEAEKNKEDLYISSNEEILNKLKNDKSIDRQLIKNFEELYNQDLKLRQKNAQFNSEVLNVFLDLPTDIKNQIRNNKIYDGKPIGERYTVDELDAIIKLLEYFLSISDKEFKNNNQVNSKSITLKAKNKLSVRPNKGPDMIKAPIKAKYADYYLGEGVPGSSTELYSKQISKSNQTDGVDINSGDVIFVSINGGTGYSREEAQDSTIVMAKLAIKNGGILLTDNIDYINSKDYNTGEKRLYDALKAEGHAYQTIELEGTKIGMWTKKGSDKTLFSKFDTESNPTQDFKDLIQSLSDKLGIPIRYDNSLPYAGAFIDGNVVLNPSKMDETTVWHEFAHPFVQAVRKQNKPLYDNLVNEIYNTPHGKALLKEVQSLYGEKNQKIQEEEVIVELIARYATGRVDGFTAKKYKGIWDKIKEFIKSIGKMIFKNNNVVDTSAVNVFTMNPTMSIKDISNMMKYSEIIWFSKAEENANSSEIRLANLTTMLRKAEYSYISKKSEIEAYRSQENYDINRAEKFLDILDKEVERVKERISNLKNISSKGFKTNEKTVADMKGVHHNLGAFMSNAGVSTAEESLKQMIDYLKNNRYIELAAWNGKGASLNEGILRISFKQDAVVKDNFTEDAYTFLDNPDSENNRERLSSNTHLRDDGSSKINKYNYTESVISMNKSNVESITILGPTTWYGNEEIRNLVKELSDLTGAPVIIEPLMRQIYTPENRVEYQPEIYESRFGKKDINKESPEAIYKEVEEVFIEMRLDEENSLDQDKINSFDLFLNSVFENSDDKHRVSVNNLLFKNPRFENYTQNKFKFQLQQYRKELEGETDPEKIDQYNTIIQILEAKELFEISDFDYQSQVENIDKESKKIVKDNLMGTFAGFGFLSFVATYATTLISQSAEVFAIGGALTVGSLAIATTINEFKSSIFNFISGRAKKKLKENFDNINANLYGLNNKERIQEYIDLINNRLDKDSDRLLRIKNYIDSTREYVNNAEEREIAEMEKAIKEGSPNVTNFQKRIEFLKKRMEQNIIDLEDKLLKDREYLSKQYSESEEKNMIKLRDILVSLLSKGNLENIPEISMNNKYEDLMDSLLRNYGDEKLDNNLIVQDMLNKVLNNKPVPGFVSRLAIRSGLMHQKNTFNKNLFKDKLMEFIEAYNIENLKSDSVKLDKLLSDYQFNQILDPVSFRNQSRLSDILLDSEYGNIPDRIKNKKHISNLTREDIMSLIELNNDLYTDAAYKMLFELNEYEHGINKILPKQIIEEKVIEKVNILPEKQNVIENKNILETKTVEPIVETITPIVEKIELPKAEENKSILTRKESLTEDLINTQKEIDYMLLIQRQSDRNKLFGKMASKNRKEEFNKHFGSLFKDSLYYKDDTNITNIIRHAFSKGKTIVQNGLLNRNATVRDLALVDQLDDYHNFIKEYDSRRMKITDLAFKRAVIRHELSNIDDALNKSNEMYNYNLVNSLKAILLDYGYQYDNISQSTKEKIEKRIIDDPDLLNNYEFIASLTCL